MLYKQCNFILIYIKSKSKHSDNTTHNNTRLL